MACTRENVTMTTYRPKEETREGFEVYDERLPANAARRGGTGRHFTGTTWAEGPVYYSDGDYVVWSDIPNDRMMRWSISEGASVFRGSAGYTNGNYRDRQGRLVSCEHGNRRISRTEARRQCGDAYGPLRW